MIGSHRPNFNHSEVVVIGDVHGNDLALVSMVLLLHQRFKNPFFIFLGNLTGTLGNSEAVLKLVTSLQNQGVACVLRSRNDEVSAEKAFRHHPWVSFLRSFKRYLIYKNFFISHAPVFKYPSPSWIQSQSLYDTYLTSFEQACFAGYDFSGREVCGRFRPTELVNDPAYIGVCGQQKLFEVTVLKDQYLCLDTSGSTQKILSAYDLHSGILVQVDGRGLLVKDRLIQAF